MKNCAKSCPLLRNNDRPLDTIVQVIVIDIRDTTDLEEGVFITLKMIQKRTQKKAQDLF